MKMKMEKEGGRRGVINFLYDYISMLKQDCCVKDTCDIYKKDIHTPVY